MKYKYILAILLVYIISCKSNNDNKDIRDKLEFASNEYIGTNMVIKYIRFNEIAERGILTDKLYDINNNYMHLTEVGYNMLLLNDNIFIDPFIDGSYEVSFKEWRGKRDEEYRKLFTLKGAPLQYQTDKKSYLLLIFAGPDQDIDNNDLPINKEYQFCPRDLNPKKIIVSPRPFRDFVIPVHKDNSFIVYDPTNGLYSNGDIIWAFFKDESNRWRDIERKRYSKIDGIFQEVPY